MPTQSTVSLTVEQCAAAIVAMIHHQPSSPRKDEIEAIVARVGTGARPHTPLRPLAGFDLQLHDAVAECLAADKAYSALADYDDVPSEKAATDRQFDALQRLDALVEQLPDPPTGATFWRVLCYAFESRRYDEATNPLFEVVMQYAGDGS